jgi:predicted O-methyltransferase YrrM
MNQIIKKSIRSIREFTKLFNIGIIRIFPRPMIIFTKDYFKDRELVGAEIGTYKGEHAENILNELNVKKLYCVDPYIQEQEDYNSEFWNNLTSEEVERIAVKRLSKFKKRYVKIHPSNANCIKNIDFVYIDGDHSYQGAKKDIEIYYPKLKKGGIIGGHNFETCKRYNYGVIPAVLEFIKENNLILNVDNNDWWVVKE